MGVNRDQPDRWKADIMRSVDMYNRWFLRFAPDAYRKTRLRTTEDVQRTLSATADFTRISTALLRSNPSVLPTLRMSTCPPLAVDRVIGLAGVSRNLVRKMEAGSLPPRMPPRELSRDLGKIVRTIKRLADHDIFAWLGRDEGPTEEERHRAATVVADRLCGANANPIIRNAQEKRQLKKITDWLRRRGYVKAKAGVRHDEMRGGTYALRLNVPAEQEGSGQTVNIPVDAVVKPMGATRVEMPLLVEAKSAGDYTNVNKRRKEEAAKVGQLRDTYGKDVRFVLFLCGYFDSGYLGYEAAEGIDWVWEHRMDDFAEFGL